MEKIGIISGIISIGIGIGINILTRTGESIFWGIILILFGLALIFFNKEESKIERRKDEK
jgi:sulfite exporter TauE/SafE|tara:strand:+ start:523 stop:702 length:180 start_codon:yes stop_codon:yes gene_type:complete